MNAESAIATREVGRTTLFRAVLSICKKTDFEIKHPKNKYYNLTYTPLIQSAVSHIRTISSVRLLKRKSHIIYATNVDEYCST